MLTELCHASNEETRDKRERKIIDYIGMPVACIWNEVEAHFTHRSVLRTHEETIAKKLVE